MKYSVKQDFLPVLAGIIHSCVSLIALMLRTLLMLMLLLLVSCLVSYFAFGISWEVSTGWHYNNNRTLTRYFNAIRS